MGTKLLGNDKQESIGRIKQKYPDTAILVISESVTLSCLRICIQSGAAGYITRDASVEQLLSTIRAVQAGEATVDLAIIKQVMSMLPKHNISPFVPDGLNPRELEILRLAARGMGNRLISEQLYLSERTVQGHMGSIFKKMGVASRTEAIYLALLNGWINLG